MTVQVDLLVPEVDRSVLLRNPERERGGDGEIVWQRLDAVVCRRVFFCSVTRDRGRRDVECVGWHETPDFAV